MADQTHDTDDEVTIDEARRALRLHPRYRSGEIEGLAQIYNQALGLLALMDQYSDAMSNINQQTRTQNPEGSLRAVRVAAVALAEEKPDAVRETLEAADR